LEYDLGGAIGLRIDDDILSGVHKTFERFRTSEATPDLTITKGRVGDTGIQVSDTIHVSNGRYHVLNANSIHSVDSRAIICDGIVNEYFVGYVLLPAVMNRILISKGWCLVHASACSFGGRNILLPAMGGTGKTSLLLDFMMKGADFIGDDKVLINKDGWFVAYQQGLCLLDYNFRVFPELFNLAFREEDERRRQRKKYSRYITGLDMKGENFVSRLIKSRLMSKYYFDHRARASDLFPDSKTVMSGRISDVFLLTREESRGIEEASADDLAPLAAASAWLDDSAWLHYIASRLSGIPHYTFEEEARVLSLAFTSAKCRRVRMGVSYERKDIESIGDEMRKLMC